jgi:putative phosphoesterase
LLELCKSPMLVRKLSTGVTMQVGLISDTHGLMRPQALDALRGSQLIIHAGDIGSVEILDALGAIAPVFAVRGNNDTQPWARHFPETDAVTIENRVLYVLHDLSQLDIDPAAAQFAAVISGHSHQPQATTRDGVLYINPGSAGPRRFKLPIAVARLHIDDHALRCEHVELSG